MASSNEEAMRLEALGDLRRCLELAEEINDLETVEGAESDLEIGALYELSLEDETPPVIVFDKIKGYPEGCRVAVNVRSSKVFGTLSGLDCVESYRKHRRQHADPIDPLSVTDGPVLENVLEGEDIDTAAFPAPRWHQEDGGDYIGTECMVITKDPDTGWVNAGTYRVMVQDKTTLCPFISPGKHGDVIRRKYWARGEPCPMVVSVGQAPVLGAAAASTAAEGVSEFAVAGARIGRAIELLDGKHTGVPFPADSELVFEGFMPPPDEQSVPEGPKARSANGRAITPPTRGPSRCSRSRPSITATTRSSSARRRCARCCRASGSAPPARRISARPRCGTSSRPPACPASRASTPCRAAGRASSASSPSSSCTPGTPRWPGWWRRGRGRGPI